MDKTFDEAIAGIRKAERGVEVREDIAQGMEYVKQYAEEVTGQQQAALQAAQTATGAASTATAQASTATSKAAAAASSATAAAASQTASKASETESAKNLEGTKKYFEQVRTITIGAQGWYATPEALKTAVPVGENGWWAVVGTTDTIWTWDSDTGAWKDSVQKADLSDYYTREQVNRLLEVQKLADHPVGSIYQSTNPTSPAALFGGTWEQIASERVLMGASSSHAAGTTAEAGLPNITGSFVADVKKGKREVSGAFTTGSAIATTGEYSNFSDVYKFSLDASKSNAIYGRSSTVQPAAYYVHIWKRVA
nr:MAG: protein of unknown function (DUF859) [Bacteriophage sp.]